MTAASERQHAPARVSTRRMSIGVVIVLGLGALAACVSDGTPTGAAPPTGVTGVGGGTSGGGGGGSSGSSGTYTLVSVNDSTPPVELFYDSVSGSGSSGDTTTVFAGILDSSFISLNVGGTATEWDYLSAYEVRESTLPGDSSFSRTVTIFDSTAGTYTVSGTTLTLTRVDTLGTYVTTFTLGTGTLTGQVPYSVYNSYGLPVQGTVSLVYDRTGSPRTEVAKPHTVAAAAARRGTRIRAQFGSRVSGGRSALGIRAP